MKKLLIIFLAVLLVMASMPMTAMANNPYADLLDGPPEQFTPEALLAANGPNEGGWYAHGYDYAFYEIAGGNSPGWTFEVVVQGDSLEFSGIAKAVFANGAVINGIVERFEDGERITIVFPTDMMGKGRYAVVISFRGVHGEEASRAIRANNGGVFREIEWDAGAFSGPAYGYPSGSPYTPTPRTASGSIEDIFYTNSSGDLCIRPNPNLSGDTPTEPPTTEPPGPGLPSDSPSTWATTGVDAAIAAGLVPQSLQSKYTQTITRAEYCALAVTLFEKYTGEEITGRSAFTDTNDVNVEKAAAIGVVNGVGNNMFAPDDLLTREQAATMLSRLAEALMKPLDRRAPTFTDNAQISEWAFEQVGQVQAAEIMSGIGNNLFSPKGAYTREQSIITMIRLWNKVK